MPVAPPTMWAKSRVDLSAEYMGNWLEPAIASVAALATGKLTERARRNCPRLEIAEATRAAEKRYKNHTGASPCPQRRRAGEFAWAFA